MVGDAKRSPWLTTASQMSAARSGGRAAGSTLGGYWRVDRGILEGSGSRGYWRVGGNFLEAGRRSAKKTGKTRRVKNVELITIWFLCPKISTKMAWFSKYPNSQQNTINAFEML